MSSLSRGIAAVIAVTLVLAISSTAQAGAWSVPSAPGLWFDYNSGYNAGTLWGNPTFMGGQFFRFTPTNFRADSVNGVSQTVSDTAQWNVVAHSGHVFSGLEVFERGYYNTSGSGPGLNEVTASGDLQACDNINYLNGPWHHTPEFRGSQQGGTQPIYWELHLSIDLSAVIPEITDMQVSLANTLSAVSGGPGNASWIQKSYSGVVIDVYPVPEPATLAMLLAGGMLVIRRRR